MIYDLVKRKDRWDLYNSEGHKVASTLKGWRSKLSLKNCQEIERGYDLDELANEWVFKTNGHKWSNNDDTAGDNCSSFKAGFHIALELMVNKNFSEADIHEAFGFGVMGNRYELGDLLKSRQHTEWEVEFDKLKLDSDGCLILKRA
jgi:hypothetical protein